MTDILLTNDDGIDAPGLWAAAAALAPIGRVTVVAPMTNQSGMSAAVRLHGPVALRRGDGADYGLPGVRWYAADVPPASCVSIGLRLYCPKPDLVVSGINPGCNMGRDVIASGTVGAACAAALAGYPAIAVSMDVGEPVEWEAVGGAITATARAALRHSDAVRGTVLNLNVPNLPAAEVRDVLVTRLSDWEYGQMLDMRESDGGIEFVWDSAWRKLTGEPGTDAWAVGEGYVSLTLLRPTLALPLAAPIEAAMRAEVRDALLGTDTPPPSDAVPTGVPS